MLALGTAVCGVAFLENSAREAPQLIEEKVPVLGSHWGSVWEAKDPVEFFVWDSGFFPRPYVVRTLGTRVGLPLPAAGLYHSALVCQEFLENCFLSCIHVALKNLPVYVL